jgi:hypothetical protein
MMRQDPDVAQLATGLLEQDARALLTRLDQVKPFVLNETMVLAATLPQSAQRAIERFLFEGRTALRRNVNTYLGWLHSVGRTATPQEQQQRFVAIRMRFTDVLAQFDLFTEVVTQRSEHDTGVWLSGLDTLAADALTLNQPYFDPPPVICYLARGPGAAIRRARTRLPGGRQNPVAIIRVPRERMIGHGIASSLIHEVGHQGAALLGLVESLRAELQAECERRRGPDAEPWFGWWRTASECVADFWSVAKLGIGSTLGLLAVVSLPRFFVFRPPGDDPHPMPYLRVLLSAAIGNTLYPHPQWDSLAATWKAYYPVHHLTEDHRGLVERAEASIPEFATRLASHRPPALRGQRLADVMPLAQRRPDQLFELYASWRHDLGVLARQPPSLVFAVMGQARAAGRVTPEHENRLLTSLLRAWAVRSSLDVLERRAYAPQSLPLVS